MHRTIQTYQALASILSSEDSAKLVRTLDAQSPLWDSLVKLGSRHLVLPAMYYELHQKQLQGYMPEELDVYLADLSRMNRERNRALLQQIEHLGRLFERHKIEYIFLKGSALLVSGIFEDLGARMLGDIDILIAPKHLEPAYELLLNHGYRKPPTSFGVDYFEHKHLPRLMPLDSTGIGAVELHSKLFQYHTYAPLSVERLFSDRQFHNGLAIPSWEHLLLHNILNWQYNDYGSLTNSLSFRSAYDTVKLLQAQPNLLKISWSNHRAINKYFKVIRGFFVDVKSFEPRSNNRYARIYKFKLRYPKILAYYNRVLRFFNRMPILWERLKMFIRNKNYRASVWKDRRRVCRLLFRY